MNPTPVPIRKSSVTPYQESRAVQVLAPLLALHPPIPPTNIKCPICVQVPNRKGANHVFAKFYYLLRHLLRTDMHREDRALQDLGITSSTFATMEGISETSLLPKRRSGRKNDKTFSTKNANGSQHEDASSSSSRREEEEYFDLDVSSSSRSHEVEIDNTCRYCLKWFKDRRALNGHLSVHSKKRHVPLFEQEDYEDDRAAIAEASSSEEEEVDMGLFNLPVENEELVEEDVDVGVEDEVPSFEVQLYQPQQHEPVVEGEEKEDDPEVNLNRIIFDGEAYEAVVVVHHFPHVVAVLPKKKSVTPKPPLPPIFPIQTVQDSIEKAVTGKFDSSDIAAGEVVLSSSDVYDYVRLCAADEKKLRDAVLKKDVRKILCNLELGDYTKEYPPPKDFQCSLCDAEFDTFREKKDHWKKRHFFFYYQSHRPLNPPLNSYYLKKRALFRQQRRQRKMASLTKLCKRKTTGKPGRPRKTVQLADA